MAEAELKLTQVVLTYARHVQAGRFPYTRVTTNAELPQAPPVAGDVLAKISDASDAALALDQFSPPHEAYQKLKAVLAEMRGKSDGSRKQIADGPLLKLVAKHPMEDARVPMLRERLGVAGDPSDLRYDAKLADAVKKFQKANELPTTGNLDNRTIKETQRAGEKPADRPDPRQHGALALVSARSRQVLFDGQSARLHAQGGEGWWRDLEHPHRHRQAGGSGDAAADRDDEAHYRQSDLERAAVDREQRVSADAGSRIRPYWRAWV